MIVLSLNAHGKASMNYIVIYVYIYHMYIYVHTLVSARVHLQHARQGGIPIHNTT